MAARVGARAVNAAAVVERESGLALTRFWPLELSGSGGHDVLTDRHRITKSTSAKLECVERAVERMNENHLDRFPGVTSRQPDRGLDVVFVSLTGGGRSQIAAALTTLLAGDNVSVHAAGTAPGGIVDPVTAAVIAELGVDISEAFARPVDGHLLARASVIVTMGHAAGSFVLPVDVVHQDWRVGDPVAATLEEARRVKDDIERRVTELLLGLDALAPTS